MSVSVIDIQNQTALGKTGQAGSGTKLGKSEFLQLLMAQLGNQNPLEPMDNKDFIAQLTQFANLEQLQNMGSSLQDLLRVTSASNSANAVSLLGKEVRIAGNEFRGPEAQLHYELPETAQSILVEVRDKNNRIVKVYDEAPKTKGMNDFSVKDLPNQDLKFFVKAKDSSGKEMNSVLSVREIVEGANFSQSIPIMMTRSGREVSAADIIEIRNTPAAAPNANPEGATEPTPSEGDSIPPVLEGISALLGI